MKVVLLSDTHALLDTIQVPDGDCVVHCGDFGFRGQVSEWKKFLEDFSKLPHKYKLFTFGNHDCKDEGSVELVRSEAKSLGIDLLVNEAICIEGKNIFGSPYTPRFGRWFWMRDRGRHIGVKWDEIPEGLDLLFTHGPPYGILDISIYDKIHCGCEELMKAVKDKKPRFHAFGHIHFYGGKQVTEDGTTFVNAALCQENYQIENEIQIIEI